MVAVSFPSWVRIALGCLVAIVTYLVAGDYIHVDDSARALIASLVLLLGGAGVVTPNGQTFNLSPAVRFGLIIVAIVLTYILNSVIDLEPIVRGLLSAVLALLVSIGIAPPQAGGSPAAAGRSGT